MDESPSRAVEDRIATAAVRSANWRTTGTVLRAASRNPRRPDRRCSRTERRRRQQLLLPKRDHIVLNMSLLVLVLRTEDVERSIQAGPLHSLRVAEERVELGCLELALIRRAQRVGF
jgi:hypothetical protein